MALPTLTPQQRAIALEKSSAARKERASLKDDLRDGKVTVAQVIERGHTEETVGKMKVAELLESLPGVGKVTAQRIMVELGISPTRRVRGLGYKQAEALVARLG